MSTVDARSNIVLEPSGLLTGHGRQRPTVEQLRQSGLGSKAAFDRWLASTVLGSAGITAHASDPKAVAAAKRVLEARIRDRGWGDLVMRHPAAHPDLRLVSAASQRRLDGGEAPLRLSLASNQDGPHDKLELVFDGLSGMQLRRGRGPLLEHRGYEAAALVGITTRAELDTAVTRELSKLAPEDVL